MNKVILLLLCAVFALSGCAKPKRLSMEEEYRKRQERRRREAITRREDRITSLSGLNAVELDELERTDRETNLNPTPGSFVFSPREQTRHGGSQMLNELNDDGKSRVKEYERSVQQKRKSRRSWVYGL